jgi:hypothetical protein
MAYPRATPFTSVGLEQQYRKRSLIFGKQAQKFWQIFYFRPIF